MLKVSVDKVDVFILIKLFDLIFSRLFFQYQML
jgi:hypothetical protein